MVEVQPHLIGSIAVPACRSASGIERPSFAFSSSTYLTTLEYLHPADFVEEGDADMGYCSPHGYCRSGHSYGTSETWDRIYQMPRVALSRPNAHLHLTSESKHIEPEVARKRGSQ